MASMEAKWKANTEKSKAAQRPEMAATTPLSNRQALFRANPGLPIATDEWSSDGAPMTVEPQRLQIAGFCLEGDASEWFRWMKRNRLIFGCHDFLEKVEQRFGTTHFEDPLVELAKLTQIGTVADFQAAFEKLLNRLPKAHEARHNELMLECRTANNEKLRPPVIHENIWWQPRGSNFSQVTIRPSANSQPNALPPDTSSSPVRTKSSQEEEMSLANAVVVARFVSSVACACVLVGDGDVEFGGEVVAREVE
nr:Retrotransposon gag protein [Ipomoea batatas]